MYVLSKNLIIKNIFLNILIMLQLCLSVTMFNTVIGFYNSTYYSHNITHCFDDALLYVLNSSTYNVDNNGIISGLDYNKLNELNCTIEPFTEPYCDGVIGYFQYYKTT